MTKLNFEIGDTVRVTENGSHKFEIGEEVVIAELFQDSEEPHYRADSETDYWYIGDEKLELVKKGEKN